MKFRSGKPVYLVLMTVAGLSAAPVNPGLKDHEPDVAAVLAKLSDDSYAVREAATRELWKLGEAALPELERTAAGPDPEAAIRARDLVRKIELGILPDSSPKIVDLVMRYDQGSKDLRQRVIQELGNERAYRQILKLYALEKDKDSLAMLEVEVKGVAIAAARDCLGAEPPDVRGAFAYLKMARPEAPEFMAMASLHRSTGTIDKALEESRNIGGPDGHLMRFGQLATTGRLMEASVEADRAELPHMAARLQLLAGDPVPWLRDAPVPPQINSPPGLSSYREIATALWQGEEPKASQLREMRRLVMNGDEEEQVKTLMLLFLAGDHEEGENLLAKINPCAAFSHFETNERIDEALKSLGLDAEKPDYTAWIRKRFKVFLEEPESERDELAELETVGSFLERRGLYQELDDAFLPPFAELAAANQDDFLMLASRLFPQGPEDRSPLVIRPVLKAVAAYAGEDEMRWTQVVEHLLDGYGSPDQLWNWLADLEPGLERIERFELMCRLHGILPDPDERRAPFMKKAWQAVEKAERIERRRLVQVLITVLSPSKDAAIFMLAVEEVEKADGPRLGWDSYKEVALIAQGQWPAAAKLWLENVARDPGDPLYRVHASACLRRAGDEAAAAEQERRAEMLALGQTRVLYDGGLAFAATGDFKRAHEWWQRAAAECTNDSGNFSKSIYQLSEGAAATADWAVAAGLREAFLLDLAISPEKSAYSSTAYQKARLESSLSRGFSKLGKDREQALKIIRDNIGQPFADTVLADYFFAPLRQAGLVKLHDEAFGKAWKAMEAVIARFPACENSRNSAAWLASRANRNLDEAETYLAVALKTNPHQAAYLDTMAEVHFALGDREKALEFSARGLREDPVDLQLIRQFQRFKSAPFPVK